MVDSDLLRRVMGNFATGVTVVTFPGDTEHGLTANAFSSVSLDPPLALVCVDHETESYDILSESETAGFCVNILSAEQRHLGEYFADMRDLDSSPFSTEAIRESTTGATVFEEALAFVDCEIWNEVPAGDHTIFIGNVVETDLLNPEAESLTFFRGDWGHLSD